MNCQLTANTDEQAYTNVVWMPSDVTHAPSPTHSQTCRPKSLSSTRQGPCTSAVRQRRDLSLPSQIPHHRIACATRRCERVLHVMIPRKRRDLVQFCTARSRRIWLAWVFEIPNIYLLSMRQLHGASVNIDTPRRSRHQRKTDLFEWD